MARSSGFTLIELLVVVAILGIISAVGIVSYNGYVSSSEKKAAENILHQISLGMTEYYSEEGEHFKTTGASATCTAQTSASSEIEQKLFGEDDVIKSDFPYQYCVSTDTASDYKIEAKETNGTCVITLNSKGSISRTNC